jgi:hypothetical protein
MYKSHSDNGKSMLLPDLKEKTALPSGFLSITTVNFFNGPDQATSLVLHIPVPVSGIAVCLKAHELQAPSASHRISGPRRRTSAALTPPRRRGLWVQRTPSRRKLRPCTPARPPPPNLTPGRAPFCPHRFYFTGLWWRSESGPGLIHLFDHEPYPVLLGVIRGVLPCCSR